MSSNLQFWNESITRQIERRPEAFSPSVRTFLRMVHPGDDGFLELRAFQKGVRPVRQFVALPLTDERLDTVDAFARQHGRTHNIYHAIATRRDKTSGELRNCSLLHALYIELDLKRGRSIKEMWDAVSRHAFPTNQEAIANGVMLPSAIVHSGGGLHVYWLLTEPLDLTTPLDTARAYQWLGDLAQKCGGEPESTEPARVLRVPDTLNLKPEYNTTPAVSLLTYNWDYRYSIDQVVAALGEANPQQPVASVIVTNPPAVDHGLDTRTRVRLARTWLERQGPAVSGDGGDAQTYQVCCGTAFGHDLTEDEALDALRDWNARCQPPWPEPELRQKIRNALRYANGQRGAKLIEFPTTEMGDAECFADQYADTVRYDHRQGRWLLAGETGIWEPDAMDHLNRFVVDMMRTRQERANLLSGDAKKKYWNWAVNGESRRRITNTLALAQSVPPLSDRGDNWDADALLLGTPTGVVDLRTGVLRPGRPEDRITLRTRTAYDPAATCPLWEQTIGSIFGDDQTLTTFVQRALGYSLTGDCREECFFICWGEGANGKGTIMNTISHVLGDYADNLSFSALELHTRSAGASPEIAKLVGRRFVTASETSDDVRLNEARVKALTGRDPMSARFLYQDEFSFQPVAKFWLATNARPQVRDNSDGFWRRVHLVPFTQSFTGPREDKTLKDRLRAEAAGILAWAVRGCLEWQRDGLNPPQAVRAATVAYRRESEQLSRWIDERCDLGPSASLQSGVAFKNYTDWCQQRREDPDLNMKKFGQTMTQRFPPDPTNKRHTVYQGIELRRPMFG